MIRCHVLMSFFSGQMLFLDEPSAAVDAGAKRHLWKVIKARAPDQYLVMKTNLNHESYLVGGFKDFSFLPLPGEMIQFDEHIFQMG